MKPHEILMRLKGVKTSGEGWMARCPAHNDERNSLSVKTGDDGKTLLHCFAGCTFDMIRAALGTAIEPQPSITTYDYQDERGETLFQVCRTPAKSFFHRRPDGRGGYINGLNGTRRVLYRQPELIEADPAHLVFIVEGEKDADRLNALGMLATTNAGGAGKWRDEYSETLRGRRVVIIPDNDEPGRQHAAKVYQALHGVAAHVKTASLPGLPEKGDVSDWLDAGGTAEKLLEIIEAAPETSGQREEAAEPSQGASLLDIARRAILFRTPLGDASATYKSPEGYMQTCAIDSPEFRQWIIYKHWQSEGHMPRKEDVNSAIVGAQGLARYEGEERNIYTRLAGHGGKIYLDLCDHARRVVEISHECWKVISADDAPVWFRRPRGMLALPVPVAGGDVRELRQFVNVSSEEDFTLLISWLVAALRGDAMKFPVLSITGEQGSAKSTITAMLRTLIDPNVAPLRNTVRNVWDVTLAANNSWCVTFNNISELSQWLSDTLCCIADGAGFAARTHHTMSEETLFQAARPIILNGIAEIATRADLLDRAVCLHLPAIPKEKRLDDAVLFSEFERARPLILGALLTGVCTALRNLPNVHIKKLPRMADFAKWATAAEGGLGLDAGTFMSAYSRNRNAASEDALEASPVALSLMAYVREHGTITMSLPNLLAALVAQFGEGKVPPEFPKSTHKLSAELKRCAPHLREAGLVISEAGRVAGKGHVMKSFSLEEK